MACYSSFPKYLKKIQDTINEKLKLLNEPNTEVLDIQQVYNDKVLKVYQEAFQSIIDVTKTHSRALEDIKKAYEDSIQVRNERISQFITQDRVFGVSVKKKERDDQLNYLINENDNLKEQVLKLRRELTKLKTDMGKIRKANIPVCIESENMILQIKINDGKFSEHLHLMRERDARYTLYVENVKLHMKLKELDGSSYSDQVYGDPVVLRIALDKCRELLTHTQSELTKKTEEYAETVPQREYLTLERNHREVTKTLGVVKHDLDAARDAYNQLQEQYKSVREELSECKERCSELERAGTPRPEWDICGDFIGGGRERWWQLASGRSSRDILRVLLKELGPAAESDHLEYFDGLGTDPMIPEYLRYEGKVRNLRLSRREVCVVINDVWNGKLQHMDVPMQDYLTHYFQDRYQQASMRAEWAYNLCAGAEQMLDEPCVRVWWGAARGLLDERVHWALRTQYIVLKDALHTNRNTQTITLEEFEKVTKATFPLKNDVDIKNLSDVVRKQLKLKLNSNEINLEKLFQENEEGFERLDITRELFRQRQTAQDKYIREVVAAAAGKRGKHDRPVTVDTLKRAFAIVDPAIDHIRMERYIRWAFSAQTSELESVSELSLRAVAARLAAGDIERVGPRYVTRTHRKYK